ncbi:LysM peptidoglycan-binding domain-containing protein [Serpentinicella alkaliphila]|uniref:Spore coat assembly protein SafA n=1 Tax=Serpentinicella alkaliphila TaxID=1734049 RepID=A0A4R2T969_9FIRM|nr:LysM domain-containing protein [Serpentinicella alkaliphila]QUH25780.1 LysM peptidoglycan-binding domain-containing protein [Serpentinicella alkaliphila]TCP99779.1 spore coat assembly protein SafA [Serpentinicella alkaliphila]
MYYYGMPYYMNPMINQLTPEPVVCPGGFIYTVQPGDTMFRIANRYGISLQALVDANPQIPNPNVLVVGQRICIPTAGVTPPVPPVDFCPGGTVYIVQPGDTLFLIARRVGVTLQRLIEANPQIADPNVIQVGQRICIPPVVPTPPVPPLPPVVCPSGTIYIVQPGDTMFIIARRFGVSLQRLIDANPQIADPNIIQVGQRICVPVPDAPLPPGICRVTLTVEPGIQALGGTAFINLVDPTLWITTFGLPKLSELGKDYCGYFAWVVDRNTGIYFCVELKDCVPGILAGYGKTTGDWRNYDEIIVTAEKTAHPKAPEGIVVLRGSLAVCR